MDASAANDATILFSGFPAPLGDDWAAAKEQGKRRRWRGMAEERILIIEDDAVVRAAAGAALERAGYSPELVARGAEAVARLRDGLRLDLIVCDLSSDGSEGGDVMATVRELSPDTPLVVLSAQRDVNVVIGAMRSGASDYLLKPFKSEQFVAGITRALERGRAEQRHAADREGLEKLVAARTELLREAISNLEQAYDITLEALGDALDLKDAETEGHSRRVTAYTIALARAMGVKGEDLRSVSRGAFLHDIGKMAIPDAILLKPGKLDRQEQAMMREHCARGYQILRKIPFLQEAAEIVYSHQERYDGSGYPRGLKGDQIVLGARIFSVADTLDAITSDRPYRRANSFEAARMEILRCAGTQFDPEVVKVFDTLPDDLWENLQTEITHHARVAALASK
ncbi:MAG: HD domain-containing phosphohydrolase [Acidobacteriaceae bacterium]